MRFRQALIEYSFKKGVTKAAIKYKTTHTFYSLNDFKDQLAVHSRKYNIFPVRPLNWRSSKSLLLNFLKDSVTHH